VVGMMLVFFWVLVLCNFVGHCQCFGETCCLHLQGPEDGDSTNIITYSSVSYGLKHLLVTLQINFRTTVKYNCYFFIPMVLYNIMSRITNII
jgi:hypothetical protein